MVMVNRFSIAKIKRIGWLLLPLLVYVIPRQCWFEGESLCLVKALSGGKIECWGCGITRAVVSVMYLDFGAAWDYNRAVVVVFPLMAFMWAKEVLIDFGVMPRHHRQRTSKK